MNQSAKPNTITVLGRTFLIAHSVNGDAAHLVAQAGESDVAQSAVPPEAIDSVQGYDRVALSRAEWRSNTACGRTWYAMSGGEAGPWSDLSPVELAPTCRTCLRVIDSLFPPPDANDSVELVASLACDFVERFGLAEVSLVPGDQLERVRRAIRAAVRARLGFSCRTLLGGDVLYVHCDEAYARHRDEHEERTAVTLANVFGHAEDTARRVFTPPEWRIDWRTWAS